MTQTTTIAPAKIPFGAVLVVLGGTLVILGSLLSWARASLILSSPVTFAGPASTAGKLTAGLGLVIALGGIGAQFPRRRRAARIAALLSIWAALFVGVYNFIDLSNLTARAHAANAFVTDVEVGEGLYVLLAGAVLAGAGCFLAQSRRLVFR